MPLTLRALPSPPTAAFTFDPATPSPPPDGSPPRPPADLLEPTSMAVYGSMPLVNYVGRAVVKCARCGRPHLEGAAAEHARICSHVLDGAPLDKKKAAGLSAKKDDKKRRASDLSDATASPISKKVKLPNGVGANLFDPKYTMSDKERFKGMRKSEIRKIKKEEERLMKKAAKAREKEAIAERKRMRASMPIDYDRQCGVINDKGLPCSRSLTCKTHTVGAKRAVEGRSNTWDILHLEWQRAHKPNFKEPAKRDVPVKIKDRRRDSKLRPRMSGAGDDETLAGPDGQRELDDLIHCARMAGERVKWAWGWLTAFHAPGASPDPLADGAGMGGGGGTVPLPKPRPRPKLAPSSTSSSSGSSTRPTSCNAVWRGAHELSSVGEMITKALNTRPIKAPRKVLAPQPGGTGVVRVPSNMATGGAPPGGGDGVGQAGQRFGVTA